MEERSTLTLCFIGYVQIVISYRSSLLLPDVPLNIPPAHTSAVSAFPIWSLGCSGRSGWLGWSGRTPPPPVWRWFFSAILSQWMKRGFSLLLVEVLEVGRYDTSASRFSTGSVLSSREGSGSDAARLRPTGLIITRKPQGLSFLTLEF